jgi:hypothetical protein
MTLGATNLNSTEAFGALHLGRELHALYADVLKEAVPKDLADLVRRLEQRVRAREAVRLPNVMDGPSLTQDLLEPKLPNILAGPSVDLVRPT